MEEDLVGHHGALGCLVVLVGAMIPAMVLISPIAAIMYALGWWW